MSPSKGICNFMRVAKEFSNTSALKDLGSSKIFALLDIPSEEREEFVSTPHEVNGETKTVDEMTTRQLQQGRFVMQYEQNKKSRFDRG